MTRFTMPDSYYEPPDACAVCNGAGEVCRVCGEIEIAHESEFPFEPYLCYLCNPPEPDPDRAYDEERERKAGW